MTANEIGGWGGRGFSRFDSERMLLPIERSKGGQYSNAILSADALTLLRQWWKVGRQKDVMHPKGWLFPGQHAGQADQHPAVASHRRRGGVHRQASRTAHVASQLRDLLEDGVDIRVIQALLGHAKLDNTAFYTRVATRTVRTVMNPLDKIAMLPFRSNPPLTALDRVSETDVAYWTPEPVHLDESVAIATSNADAFVAIVGHEGADALVANLATAIEARTCGVLRLPCSVTTERTCYVCSPSVAYADYASEELRLLGLGRIASGLLAPLPFLGRALIALARLDRQVQINNWLLSTNPPPVFDPRDLKILKDAIVTDHPDKAVYLRSLNERTDASLIASLAISGWRLIPSRLVYLFDCRSAPQRRHLNEQRDEKLLAASTYTVVAAASFSATDFDRAQALYVMLYLDKYTPLNPQYTVLFLYEMSRLGLIELFGLRSVHGRLDGIIGFFDEGRVMTAPIVGYDTGLDLRLGLYRMLMSIGFKRARRRRMLFNISAGAGSFKRLRGAEPTIEYSAAYVGHRPLRERVATSILARILTSVAVPLMRRMRP